MSYTASSPGRETDFNAKLFSILLSRTKRIRATTFRPRRWPGA